MNIIIIEKCTQTREMLCNLLKEDGFDQLEVFAGIDEAITKAHWNDTDMLLTDAHPETAQSDPVIRWVRRFYPHITSIGHSLRRDNIISYAPIP